MNQNTIPKQDINNVSTEQREQDDEDIVSELNLNAIGFRENNITKSMALNQQYLNGPDTKIDTFEAYNQNEYIVMFLHAGKWTNGDKSMFSHLANGLIQNNISVVMPSHTKCPNTTVEGIVSEIRNACMWVHKKYKKKIVVVGQESGAHLAAAMFATQWPDINRDIKENIVEAGVGITGIYNLNAVVNTSMNDTLNLTPEEAEVASPIKWMPPGAQRFIVVTGGDDVDELKEQSKNLAKVWSRLGTPTEHKNIDGMNQDSIAQDLQNQNSEIVRIVVKLTQDPRNRRVSLGG